MTDHGEHAAVPCGPCVAYLGAEFAAEVCTHGPAAQRLARKLASIFQGVEEPTEEQVGWFMEDAEGPAHEAQDDQEWVVEDLGDLRDERRHLVINGKRWATPDPNAEGFNPIVEMTECTHPWHPDEYEGEPWAFDDEDSPCELCTGTGWTSYTPEELAEAAANSSSGADR